jgi:hypothetical protein
LREELSIIPILSARGNFRHHKFFGKLYNKEQNKQDKKRRAVFFIE